MGDFTKITVNGREYDSIDHMPPDIREIYLQATAALRESGAPQMSGVIKKNLLTTVKESFTYNGREYHSRDELPPEARKLFENISELPPDKISDVKIVTDRTIFPGARSTAPWGPDGGRPERDPNVLWMLVAALSAVVVVLLFLLYLSSRHKGG
jgi:hypothetical protein